MTNNNSNESRLDRIERILESENYRILSIERTVQAMLEQRVTDKLEHEERLAKYDGIISRLTDVQEGMAKMLEKIDETQPTILRRLMAIENKIDCLIEKNQ